MAQPKRIDWKEMTWPLALAILLVLCLGLSIALFSGGDRLADRSFNEGRRVAITLSKGEILGNPFVSPAPETAEEPAATEGEAEPAVPEVIPQQPLPAEEQGNAATPPEPYGPSQPQMNPAVPANFVGGQLESKQPGAAAETFEAEKKTADEYPLAVKPDPQNRQLATAAPAPEVTVRELLQEAKPGAALELAPITGLIEKTEAGLELPKIGSKGTRPWEAYAKPFSPSYAEPLVAVIISDLGMNHSASGQALKLDEHFTYSFTPYGSESEMWARTARSIGHEVLMDWPMQMEDFPASDPGPQGMLLSLKTEDNIKRLRWVMSRFPGYVGLLAPMNASVPDTVIRPALSEIGKRGILFVRSATAVHASGASGNQGDATGLVELTASLLIDSDPSEPSIRAKLADLVAIAKKEGKAIGIARAFPITLEILQAWQKDLTAQGVRLAPVSALAARGK